MSEESKKQIFDYIFGSKDVPDHIMEEFSRWLVEHEGDEETEYIMLKKWEEYSGSMFDKKDLNGLKDIRKNIRSAGKSGKCRTIAAFVMTVAFFALGYFVSGIRQTPTDMITLVTAKNNIGSFILPDGTKVWLSGNSRLTYPETFSGTDRQVSLSGEGFFEVIKDCERPFTVKMNNIDIEVLGTSFGAVNRMDKGHEEVILKTGSVKISGEALEQSITLKPNQMLSYSSYDGTPEVKDVNAHDTCRWYEECLVFDNVRFGDIMTNIGRRFNVDVKLLTSVPMDKRMSMTIANENLGATIDLIAALLPIRYEIVGNTIIIKDKYPKL